MAERETSPGHDACGGLFGCGGGDRRYMVEPEAVDAALTPRVRDRLDHLDELDRDALEPYLASYRVSRRRLMSVGGFLGLLASVAPAGLLAACSSLRGQALAASGGREHVVASTPQTVQLGVFDSTRPNVAEIEPGDTIVYPNTWTHFLNRMQPGVAVTDLAKWRLENPGKGPHSIIGPVGVRGAKRGDMLSVRFLRLTPLDWGANFNNPASLKTGALPDEFPEGQVRYIDIDPVRKVARFSTSITLPLGPFQGTFGVAAPEDAVGRVSPGVVSSVPPGQHAGNVDLREQQEGSTLYIPVWQPDAKIFTGDSHALQGDGEVNLTALETGMREVRVQVGLHEQAGWAWPFAETDTHWIALGMHRDLGQAFKIALSNTLDFLARRANLTRLDAYSLASLATSFRVTQVVDINQGVHAMIPKEIFARELRETIRIV